LWRAFGVADWWTGSRPGCVRGRCCMQAATVRECLTFFLSIAVLIYLWLQ
jgi:hypothetical protein